MRKRNKYRGDNIFCIAIIIIKVGRIIYPESIFGERNVTLNPFMVRVLY